jgi:hypothetical protein
VGSWLHEDLVDAGKWPLMLCFVAFVLTFLVTRLITRLIRAGRGPFGDVVTSSGTHIHHSAPGVILLIIGAFVAVANAGANAWFGVAAVMIGAGVSLVLDEFALILHLEDVYWEQEGRLSVNLVSLTAAYLGLALTGLSPIGVDHVGGGELAVRLTAIGFVALHGALVLVCVAKGKYRLAVLALPVPVFAIIGAIRMARPGSLWARRFYSGRRTQAATSRAARFDRRWKPVLGRWDSLVGGIPSSAD